METQLNNETRQEIDLPKINGFIHQVTHKYINETSEQHLNRMVEEWGSLNENEKQFVQEKGAKTAVSLIGEIAYEYESMPKDREKEIINEFKKAIKDIQEYAKKVVQENTQPTNIRLGDKFLFDNKPYEVYHIREQHDPKIYLEHTAEDGIRDELTYYQSDIVKALKENKIEMIDKRELIENEVTNHDIIKMWADKPEQENNMENNVNQENNMKENTTKTDEVLNIYNNLNSETKNLLKQNFWAEQERHTNWHNSDYSDTREQDKLEKLFDNANNFIKAEYKEAKEKIFNTIEYTDFYEIVINNPNLKDNVNQEQKDLFKNLNNIDEKAREIIESWYEHTEKVGFDFPSSEEFKKDLEAKTSYTFEIDNYGQPINLKLKNMTTEQSFKQQEFLKNQMKYLGFGESEKLHQDLMKGINSEEAKFNIATTSDRVMTGNKVEFQLHFNKTDKGGIFLNSYEAKLTTKQGEERSHTFKVQKSNNVTAKEAINLLEGRAVKIEKTNINEETGEITNDFAFIKLKLREPKTDYNNYKFEMYGKNYGVDVENIMEKANLVFTNDTQRERVKQNLEKGNVTNVTFQHDKKVIEGFAVLNPQWKMLNLYDEKMNRVNSNKVAQTNELQDNQKNNVREQHISRSL